MKKVNLLLFAIAAIFLGSCQQDLPEPAGEQDVVINISPGEKGLKSGADCLEEADYALLKLVGIEEPLVLDILEINGTLYTAAMKLAPGSYILEEFFLMKNAEPEDIVVSASPHIDSDYGEFVVNPVHIPFEVGAFVKAEISVDVLCFDEAESEEFGFTWFKINVYTLREGLFFGDHCSEVFAEYAGSKYGDDPKFDMAAIYKIELYLDEDGDETYELLVGSFNNYEDENGEILVDELGNPVYVTTGSGSSVPPLSVFYIDRPNVEDYFKLVISVYQKTDAGFDYVAGDPWFFTDDMSTLVNHPGPIDGSSVTIETGADGVYDFISGPCVVSEFDFEVEDPGNGDDAEVCGHLYLDTNGNGTQDQDEPDLANVDVIITASNGDTQTVSSDANGDWCATVPPGQTSADVDENDPDYPTGYTQTEGYDPTTIDVVTGQPNDGGIDGYYFPTDDCDDCDGGLVYLKLRYDGSGSVSIEVKDDNETYFSDVVLGGNEFSFEGTKDDGKFEKNNLEIYIDGQLNTEIHVSCSQDVNPGLSFGDFTITDAIDVKGNHICPADDDDNGGGDGGSETAFGYDSNAGVATCFLDINDLQNQRWGWTNQYEGDKDKKYEIKLYAGASHCNPNTEVGKFKFEVKNGKIKDMKFDLDDEYKLADAHVYVGEDILPIKNGSYTVSPGQFTLKKDGLNDDKYEFPDEIDMHDEDFYLIAHCTVVDK